MELITAITTGVLFAAAVFLILRRNLIRSAIGLIILANAINLFLLATGAYSGTIASYANDAAGIRSDALPQALILTAIVISMGGFAFVLSMLYIISARYETSDSDEVNRLKY